MKSAAQQPQRSGRARDAGAEYEVICRRWLGTLYVLCMNYKCEETSALLIASTELVETVGKAMIVFAAIEGFVNLVLHNMTTDTSDLKRLPRSISRRLNFFGELACQSPALTSEEVNEIISRAKRLFHQRNLIAHSPRDCKLVCVRGQNRI